ncbi:MAG: cytochrome oxidase biogenesis protein CtaA [Verrucomicrobia bacterium]|nr:MAG: cytochrome oxidase biogenesis protein CtaA [Verrucomicrobiota bacterium]
MVVTNKEAAGKSAAVADGMRTHAGDPNRWLNRFAWFTVAATLLLICSGGMVTSKNAGLAVPDWPTTFGYNMFLFPASKWVGGILFEHTHRLIASTVGFLTLILAGWLWRTESRRWVQLLGLAAVGAVILQGVLGGIRVTLLKDEIGIFHACLAQAFLGLLVVIALVTSQTWIRANSLALADAQKLRALALATTATYGQWIPDTSSAAIAKINSIRDARGLSDVTVEQIWLQMAHRFGAIIVTAGVIAFFVAAPREKFSPLRKLSGIWLIGIFLQLALGAWTIWSNKAADIATAHVAVGATMFGLGIAICAFCLKRQTATEMPPSRRSSLASVRM